MSIIAFASGPCFRIKVKTPHSTTIITTPCPSADHAWDRAWSIAGDQPASISVQVLP